MYQDGDYVVYGVQGVCRVLGKEKQLVNRKRTEYLVLEPLARGEAKFYLPSANPTAMAKLRSLHSREEMDAMFDSDEIRKDCWIKEESLRRQCYRDLLAAGDSMALLQMLGALYHHKDEQAAAGKKFHMCDDNFLRDAEKLLCSEICVVMDMDAEQAREFLRTTLR